MAESKLRVQLNMGSLVKSAELASNAVLLASNAYLAGSGLSAALRQKKQVQRQENLQMAAELASAVASGVKVVAQTYSRYHHE